MEDRIERTAKARSSRAGSRGCIRRPLLLVAAIALLSTVAMAATSPRVWIVDRVPGRGDFVTIAAAVAAATPGDVIRVRKGVHAMPGVVTIGVTILGEAGAVLDPYWSSLRVTSLPASQRFVLADVSIRASFEPRFQVDGCAGPVHFVGVRGAGGASARNRSPGLWIRDSASVTLDDCVFGGGPAIEAWRSAVRITRSVLLGRSNFQGRVVGHALRLRSSNVVVSDSALLGSSYPLATLCAPAVSLVDGSLELRGGDLVAQGGHFEGLCTMPAIHGGGAARLVLGSRIRMNPLHSSVPPVQGVTPILRGVLPTIGFHDAGPGSAQRIEVSAVPFATVFFAVGQLGARLRSPLGDVWLDPGAAARFSVATADAAGRAMLTLPVHGPVPPGLVYGAQALVVQGPVATVTWPAVRVTR